MNDVHAPAGAPTAKPILDIGALLSGTFKLYFRRFFYFFGITLLSLAAIYVLAFALLIPFIQVQADLVAEQDSEGLMQNTLLGMIPFGVVIGLGYIVLTSVIVRSAITVQLKGRVEFGAALLAALQGLVPLALFGLLLLIPLYLGFLLLLIPGLYLVAMIYALTPAVVFERRGFGGFMRSIRLTSGYRWAIMGFFVVLAILSFLISIMSSMVFGGIGVSLMFAATSAGNEVLGAILYTVSMVLNLVATAATTPLGFIAIAAVYVRLREIKEGGGPEVLKVFE